MVEDILAVMDGHLDKDDLSVGIKLVLIELSIPTDLIGYRCLTNAVHLRYLDSEQSLTKEIYPEVGHRCAPGLSGVQVERNIRYSIDAAWERRDAEMWRCYFPDGKKPTNGQFISNVAEILHLWQACAIQSQKK